MIAAGLLAMIACTPDYGHTAFLCDIDADCPAEQLCVDSRCRRGSVDEVSIACRISTTGTAITCGRDEQCCTGDGQAPHCISARAACDGIGALCDGVADCMSGDHCCVEGDILACNASCEVIACRSDDDCPHAEATARRYCCGVSSDPLWGTCQRDPCS